MTDVYITREKYEALRDKLDELKEQKQKVALEIAEAASQGDLRENAAYTYSKQQQERILSRINDIQTKLSNAKLLDDVKIDKSKVRIGATVTLKEAHSGEKTKYTLVGSEESDPLKGHISVDTPISRAMLGKNEGENFTVELPKGHKTFKILKLEYI